MTAEVEVVVVAAAEEIVMLSKVVAEEIAMPSSRTERRAPVHLQKRRNQRLI